MGRKRDFSVRPKPGPGRKGRKQKDPPVIKGETGACLTTVNPTYQAFVTLQPDWLPFNSLGAGVANKRQYKTGKVTDLPHLIILTKLQ